MVVQVLKNVTIENGELATSVAEKKWKWNSCILESLIAFIFGVLVNVGKKIVCLQCGFKNWCESRDIDCGYDVILRLMEKTHSSLSHVLFMAICFALSWPCNSLPWILISLTPLLKDTWWTVCGTWSMNNITI